MRSARHPRLAWRVFGVVSAVIASLSGIACASQSCDSGPGPQVCAVAPAIAAVQAEAGRDAQFFEIAAYADSVHLVVKTDSGALAYEFADGELTPGDEFPGASGASFPATVVDFDPESIFDQLRQDLDDPAISDFAVTGGPDGTVVYDAKILSEKGGNLLVQLDSSGGVLGVQAN